MAYKRSKVGMCCINCDKRYPGCHDKCETFQKAKLMEVQEKERVRDAAKIERQWLSYKAQIFDGLK